ncbi:hypothetical protein JL720_14540 [Aureococcus anophagefferens]|nr:hypothetical protein JL720_14540 [Aureococcus anophagefferens]
MVADPRLNTHTGRICNHMNVDHVHTVLAMARMEWPAAQRASLTEVTETGVAIVAARGGERRELAIAFKPPAKDMMEARSRLTALHRAAKGEVSETRGCYEILWDNGDQNAIPVADVQRFEQRFKCCHAHHPDFRAAPAGWFEDYETVVTDHDAVASVACETRRARATSAGRRRSARRAGTDETPAGRPAKKRASGGAPRGRGAPAAAGVETVRSARPAVGDAVEVGWVDEADREFWPEAAVVAHDAGGFVVTYAGTDERVAHGLVFGDLGEGEKTAILLDFLRHMEEADVADLLPQALNAYFRARAPREARDAFVSSIQVNRYDSWRDSAPHADRNNLGPSWIIAFGEFEEASSGSRATSSTPRTRSSPSTAATTTLTLPLRAARYSLVFYCVASHARLGKSDRDAAAPRLPPPAARRGPAPAARRRRASTPRREFDARAHDDYPTRRPPRRPFG